MERAKWCQEALISQRPAFLGDFVVVAILCLCKAHDSSDSRFGQRSPLPSAFAPDCLLGLPADGIAGCGEMHACGLLTCLHNIALQATRSCVVGGTPSVTPPRWFLVMEVSALPCHCPQLPLLCAYWTTRSLGFHRAWTGCGSLETIVIIVLLLAECNWANGGIHDFLRPLYTCYYTWARWLTVCLSRQVAEA